MASIIISDSGNATEVADLDEWYFGEGWEYLAYRMDDDIRESLHLEMAPCEPRAFLAAYCDAHEIKYDEVFRG